MTTETTRSEEAAADYEFVSTRVFDVTPEQLFAAYRDPARLAKWWGPDGFTNTFEKFELQTGGEWRFVMHGPDGKNYKNESVFKEVLPANRIVFDHISAPHFIATHTIEGVDGKARLTWRMRFDTEVVYNMVKPIIPAANEQNFNRLEVQLAEMQTAGNP